MHIRMHALYCSHSNMGYMELKRSHQELTTELQAMEGKSRDMDHQYHIEVEKLLVELQECKVRVCPFIRHFLLQWACTLHVVLIY